jgi:hypothetical protein
VQDRRVLQDERAKLFDVIRPDGIDDVAGHDEPRPVRDAIAAGERELCIGERYCRDVDVTGSVGAKFCDRVGVAPLDGT